MKKLVGLLFHRVVLVGASIVIQVLILLVMVVAFSDYFIEFYFFCIALSVAVVLWIVGNRSNPAYKVAWLIPILAFPVFGGVLYLLFGGHHLSRRTKRRMQGVEQSAREALERLPASHGVMERLEDLDPQPERGQPGPLSAAGFGLSGPRQYQNGVFPAGRAPV